MERMYYCMLECMLLRKDGFVLLFWVIKFSLIIVNILLRSEVYFNLCFGDCGGFMRVIECEVFVIWFCEVIV